jgi:hypothetical protein
MGFVFAGALLGLLLDDTFREQETRLNLWLDSAERFALAAYAAVVSAEPLSADVFLDHVTGVLLPAGRAMTATVGLAFLWESRPGGSDKWSPMQQLGRTSLFIY